MAQTVKSSDVLNDAITKSGMIAILLMPFIVWDIQRLEAHGLVFPVGYDYMAAAAIQLGITKAWAYFRLKFHLKREDETEGA